MQVPLDVSRFIHSPPACDEGVHHVPFVIEVLRPCLLVLDDLSSPKRGYERSQKIIRGSFLLLSVAKKTGLYNDVPL